MNRILTVDLPRPHAKQAEFINSPAKRRVIRAGRRSGKTVGIAIYAVQEFLKHRRVLYGAPTQEQIDRFWSEVCRALAEPIEQGVFNKNETKHIVELSGTEQRIRAKTCFNADTLRGDYADVLILDEFQLMDEATWAEVGAPLLMDNNGDASFIFTPPSLHSRSMSKATDKRHANKLWKRANADPSGRWAAFHFTSYDNPHISNVALSEISSDMTPIAIRQEIGAEDIEEVPGALWKHEDIEAGRVTTFPELTRVGIGIDPHASTGKTGIVAAGIATIKGEVHAYILDDSTTGGSPSHWASAVVADYNKHVADIAVGEVNNGGDMIENTIRNVEGGKAINYKEVRATRGKYTRAEPISALYGSVSEGKPSRVHHVGYFPELEEQMCSYVPGDDSPNNMDALVWILTELMGLGIVDWDTTDGLGHVEGYKSQWE